VVSVPRHSPSVARLGPAPLPRAAAVSIQNDQEPVQLLG
jgi:hypothetical protein